MKKIFSIIMSFLILTLYLCLPVSAESCTQMTDYEYKCSISYLLGKLYNREITFAEYQEQAQAVTDKFYADNDYSAIGQNVRNISNGFAGSASAVGGFFDYYGDIARDKFIDSVKGLMDSYKVLNDVPTTDNGGYGCKVLAQSRNNPNTYNEYYAEYVVINPACLSGNIVIINDSSNFRFHNLGRTKHVFMSSVDVNVYDTPYDMSTGCYDCVVYLYGDVRYLDGTQAPTDDSYEQVISYDFSQASEMDIDKLLNGILAILKSDVPDLSSIDGLLQSIYYRLGTLDSDNDNELLSQILTAIKAISNDSSNTDNSELLEILENIKKSLVFEDGENSATLADELKQIIDNQLTADDFIIDEKLYNNNGEILKLRLLGKFSFINELKEFVSYIFETYKNSSDTPEISMELYGENYIIDMNLFKDYLPLVQSILAASIYISYGYHTYRKIPSYINGGDNE